MKGTFEEMERAAQLWGEASAKLAGALQQLVESDTAATRRDFNLHADVERDARTMWNIAAELHRLELVERSVAATERIATALEKLARRMEEKS